MVLANLCVFGIGPNRSAVDLYETSTAYSTAYNVFPDRFSSNELTAAYLTTLAPQTSQLNFFVRLDFHHLSIQDVYSGS